MKLLHILALLLATMAVVSAAFDLEDYTDEPEVVPGGSEMQEATTSLRGVSRFLTSSHSSQQDMYGHLTCNKYPRVCRQKKSPGPDCCKKKCVNVKTDRKNCGFCGRKCKYTESCCKGKCVNVKTEKYNCGVCGHKCKYTEKCCKGKCVNVTRDKKNCGGCGNKCNKGEWCVYGMCNYA